MSTMTSFNPTDPKYQIKDEFKADKEKLWPYPLEKDGWMHAHNSLRDEMRNLVEALEVTHGRRASLEEWEVKCIKRAWAAHEVHVHSHHNNEDAIMVPYLETRFKYPDKYEADHETLVAQIEKIAGLVKILRAGDSSATLKDELTKYENMMKSHLVEEEVECLPLCRAYFTPQEIAKKVQQIMSKATTCELGSFINTMGPDKFRTEFMPQEGIPFFVWYLQFKWMYNTFKREFTVPIEALKTSTKPAKM